MVSMFTAKINELNQSYLSIESLRIEPALLRTKSKSLNTNLNLEFPKYNNQILIKYIIERLNDLEFLTKRIMECKLIIKKVFWNES